MLPPSDDVEKLLSADEADAAMSDPNSEDDRSEARCDSPGADAISNSDSESQGTSKPRKRLRASAPVTTRCGELPFGSHLAEFLTPPAVVHARNAEGLYWLGCNERLRAAGLGFCNSSPGTSAEPSFTSMWLDPDDASAAADRQKEFFKSICARTVDLESARHIKPRNKEDCGVLALAQLGELRPRQRRSPTAVMEAAFFLIREGYLNIPDVGSINVKQARAFLWNAAWLQEFMNAKWRGEGCSGQGAMLVEPPKFAEFKLAIMGPGGTGKTAVLKLAEALTLHFAGPATVRKLAPSNAAARLLAGDTIHAVCKLPYGNTRLTSKKGRLAKEALTALRKKWRGVLAAYIDEVSMISSDQFAQCDVRMRQAKLEPTKPFGGLATNFCGDFLQLPPVDKTGDRKSLAVPITACGRWAADSGPARREVEQETVGGDAGAESRQGFDLWRSIPRAVCLSVNVRSPGVLSRFLAEMREGSISQEMWDLYLQRVIVAGDKRLKEPPFVSRDSGGEADVKFVVHRHRIRVMRSFDVAKSRSAATGVPLFVVQASDAVVNADDVGKLTAVHRRTLLTRVNPEHTKGLPSFLPLHLGMRLILGSKECANLGVMKGCPCELLDVVLHPLEQLAFSNPGEPHMLQYMPTSLLLRAEEAEWKLHRDDLPRGMPKGMNLQGVFQLKPACDYLRVPVDDDYVSVRRTSFLVEPADTRTVYSAQGSTWDAVVADMARPPRLDPARHWLACYVMLSRARSVDGVAYIAPSETGRAVYAAAAISIGRNAAPGEHRSCVCRRAVGIHLIITHASAV